MITLLPLFFSRVHTPNYQTATRLFRYLFPYPREKSVILSFVFEGESTMMMDSLSILPSLLIKSVFWSHENKGKLLPTIPEVEQKLKSKRKPPSPVSTTTTTYSSQKDAQTALLLSVIRATPNEVFFSLAKDLLIDTYNQVTTFVRTVVSGDIPSMAVKEEETICLTCHRSRSPSFLRSAEFLFIKAFVRMVVKLYLSLILELTTVALKLLG